MLQRVCEAARGVPILLGSGVAPSNASELCEHAAGAIIGTSAKVAGDVARPVDVQRVQTLRAALDRQGSEQD